MFSFLSSLIRFFLSLTSSTIYMRLALALDASWENLSLSFSSFPLSFMSFWACSSKVLFWSLRELISALSLMISSLFLELSSSAFLILIYIMFLSLIRLTMFVFSDSVCFLKYSISLVRALTPDFVIFFSLSASIFSLANLSLSLRSALFSLL